MHGRWNVDRSAGMYVGGGRHRCAALTLDDAGIRLLRASDDVDVKADCEDEDQDCGNAG
jgi:hypothetical protein